MEWLRQINEEINELAKTKIDYQEGYGKKMHRKFRFFDVFTIGPDGFVFTDRGIEELVQSVIAIMSIQKIDSLVEFKNGNIIDLSIQHESNGQTFFLLQIKEHVANHEVEIHPAFGE